MMFARVVVIIGPWGLFSMAAKCPVPMVLEGYSQAHHLYFKYCKSVSVTKVSCRMAYGNSLYSRYSLWYFVNTPSSSILLVREGTFPMMIDRRNDLKLASRMAKTPCYPRAEI